MNSKEALEQLKDEGYKNEITRLYNIIKQDLERFEECKKENCDYQIKNAELQEDFWLLNESNIKLDKENTKLKKAIEILKRFNFSINETRHNNTGYEIWTDSLLELTQEEYELLKEVLGNETNI